MDKRIIEKIKTGQIKKGVSELTEKDRDLRELENDLPKWLFLNEDKLYFLVHCHSPKCIVKYTLTTEKYGCDKKIHWLDNPNNFKISALMDVIDCITRVGCFIEYGTILDSVTFTDTVRKILKESGE